MKKILFSIFLSVSIYSCSEFLKPSSKNEYTPENIEALAEILVGNVYMSPTADANLFSLSEVFSDNVSTLNYREAKVRDTDKALLLKNIKMYCFDPEMFNPMFDDAGAFEPDTWEIHYAKIRSCNAILDYIDNVKADNESVKMRVLAETHFFRAFFYFSLVNTFSKPYNLDAKAPGVPIKLTSEYNPDRMKRNTVEEVYSQIISDMNLSEEYFTKFANGEYFIDIKHPSVNLLYAFRSRVALYMENWADAKKYSEKVIDSDGRFKLYDLNSFVPSDKKPCLSFTNLENVNSETIFVYGSTKSISTHGNVTCVVPPKTGINPSKSDLNISYFVASPDLVNLYKDGDLRKNLYLNTEYVKNTPIGPIEGFYKIYSKVNTNEYQEMLNNVGNFGFTVRISELYLNYAEACAKLNKGVEARAKMTDLLSKRYISGSVGAIVPNIDGEELVDYIRVERRKELCFEGHRLFDQKRSGMKGFERLWYEGGELVHKINVTDNDPAFMLKLTPSVLLNNSKLDQNQNWSKKY